MLSNLPFIHSPLTHKKVTFSKKFYSKLLEYYNYLLLHVLKTLRISVTTIQCVVNVDIINVLQNSHNQLNLD